MIVSTFSVDCAVQMCYCTSPLRVHPYSYFCLTQYPSTSRDDSCSNVQSVALTIDFRVKPLDAEANSCLGDRNRSATKKVWRASSISSGQSRQRGAPTISHCAGSFWSSRGPSLSEKDRNQVYFIMSLLDLLYVNHPGCLAIPSILLLPQGPWDQVRTLLKELSISHKRIFGSTLATLIAAVLDVTSVCSKLFSLLTSCYTGTLTENAVSTFLYFDVDLILSHREPFFSDSNLHHS